VGGRIADSDKGTIYSPRQIDQMKDLSDKNRDNSSNNGVVITIFILVLLVAGISFFLFS
jgi:hypothetical protein